MCPNGYLDDANGCATCQCKPPTTCGPVCAIFCAYGNVLDPQGCPTCACNPPPTGPCSAIGVRPGARHTVGDLPGRQDRRRPDLPARPDRRLRLAHHHLPPAAADLHRRPVPDPAPGRPQCPLPRRQDRRGPRVRPQRRRNLRLDAGHLPDLRGQRRLHHGRPLGQHRSASACPTRPPGPCPCAAGQICVTQIGGPAIPDPPPSHCEAPDAMLPRARGHGQPLRLPRRRRRQMHAGRPPATAPATTGSASANESVSDGDPLDDPLVARVVRDGR